VADLTFVWCSDPTAKKKKKKKSNNKQEIRTPFQHRQAISTVLASGGAQTHGEGVVVGQVEEELSNSCFPHRPSSKSLRFQRT